MGTSVLTHSRQKQQVTHNTHLTPPYTYMSYAKTMLDTPRYPSPISIIVRITNANDGGQLCVNLNL